MNYIGYVLAVDVGGLNVNTFVAELNKTQFGSIVVISIVQASFSGSVIDGSVYCAVAPSLTN